MRSVIFFEASAPASEAISLRREVGIMRVGIIGERVGVDRVDEKDGSTSSVLSVDKGRGRRAGDLRIPRAQELETETGTGCAGAEVGTVTQYKRVELD